MKAAITYGVFPTTFAAALAGTAYGLHAGWSEPLLVIAATAATVVIVAICERLNPEYPGWNRPQEDVRTDLMHAAVSMVAVPELIKAGLVVALMGVAVQLSEIVGFGVWPAHWPLAGQLALALLLSQFGEYWVHRGMHEIPLLWRLHATHHSPGRLYWLNAARFHPLDTAASYTIATAPLLALGAGSEVVVLFTVWVSVHGMFQHSNIHLRLGPLNYLFSMAELHRWHHSLVLEEANTNYGNNIIFWDLVFGTFFWPRDRDADEEIGLSDISDFPKGYLAQILSPFRWTAIAEATDG